MNEKLKKRNETDDKFKWHIQDIFKSDEEWEELFSEAEYRLPALNHYKGKLGTSGEELLNYFKLSEEISLKLSKLYVYANMRMHEDSSLSKYQALATRAEALMVQFATLNAFAVPEILKIPEKLLLGYLAETEGLDIYRHYIADIQRNKKHVLSAAKEELIAQFGEVTSSFDTIFTMLNDADIRFPKIKDENGNVAELTKGRYISYLESPDEKVRKNAFKALYDTYLKQKNTLSALYASSVKKDVVYSRLRKHRSAREASLFKDNIPVSVYDNLVSTVRENIGLMHRYVALRKRVMGLKKLEMCDLYAPLVPEYNRKIPFDEAKETVLRALAPMGEDYISKLKAGMDGGWLDVYENSGKRGGAYAWGVYSVHPFVLLNYNDNINSMFTLAHEMGHALHSAYTWENIPYVYSGHSIFVAEVASTVNEALLMEYLLKNTSDKKERLYLLNHFTEQFRGTLFRQTMFAEFEAKTHAATEAGEALTCETLSDIYGELNRFYFGKEISYDKRIEFEWARIPHFYEAFYVYKYATGYSAAIALSRRILSEGAPAVEDYINFLKKGDSEYPIDLLKGAGVDMTKKQPIEAALKVFEELLDEMEREF
ncbi:MAG: oligoendopeptidase F [Firmicutes bacterium]|nr:oligoendopeptidase F [Bacillota bacterium]